MEKFRELLKKRLVRFIFLAVSGVLTGFTVIFPALGILEWFSLVPMGLVIISVAETAKKYRRTLYLYGLFFFMCYFVTVWHWFFVMYPMSYTGMSEIAALSVLLAAVVGLPALQSVSFALIFLLFGIAARTKISKRFPVIPPLFFAALWAILEWTETLFWFGVPWGRLSIGQTEILVTAETASWFGCTFISFVIVAVSMLAAYAVMSPDRKKLLAAVAAAIFSVNTIAGAVILTVPSKTEGSVKVAVIQGNIGTDDKWETGWFNETSKIYKDLSKRAADDGAEILIWPETVLHVYLDISPASSYLVSSTANENGTVLLVGTVTHGEDGGGQYNSIVTVFPDGSFSDETYSKQHLVPFGEYVPWHDFITAVIPALDEINMLESPYTPGNSSVVVDTGKGKVGSAVCFDSIYGELLRESALNGAEFFAIETNDAWFYDSRAVYMHLAQAKLRAIENRRYVARAANTGISAVIDEKGRLISSVPPLEEGYAVEEISLISENTLYTYIGDLFVLLCGIGSAALLSLCAAEKIRSRRGGKEDDK